MHGPIVITQTHKSVITPYAKGNLHDREEKFDLIDQKGKRIPSLRKKKELITCSYRRENASVCSISRPFLCACAQGSNGNGLDISTDRHHYPRCCRRCYTESLISR